MKILKVKIHIIEFVIIIAIGIFSSFDIHAQSYQITRIHVIRERNFLGSGNKMDIQINGESVFKLKNGNHLVINSKIRNPIEFQIVYPVMKRFKSDILHFSNENEVEIYLLVSYKGAGENFRIEMKQLTSDEGEEILKNSKRYSKKTETTEIN